MYEPYDVVPYDFWKYDSFPVDRIAFVVGIASEREEVSQNSILFWKTNPICLPVRDLRVP